MFDRPLVFLDLETTGATATHDRITEIGLIEVENGEYTGEWSTLINPQTRIPPFIESLTGISNAMVADAPTFEDVAAGLKARARLNGAGDDETGYLAPLREIVASGKTPAEQLLDLYHGEWRGDIGRVYQDARF